MSINLILCYTPSDLKRQGQTVGVFVGAVWTMYQLIGAEQTAKGTPIGTNSYLWAVANRISHNMDFNGPSMAVDTACSSSLTALHLAYKSIQDGECTSAMVGGVNLDVHPSKRIITNEGGFLSPDGRCATFAQDANGYVAGEGVGAILLKPLSEAKHDNDRILGVIKATAINHGGRTSGFTVPNPKAQSSAIAKALKKANVDAETISYVEAHGTGTKLGDPIEIVGLSDAFDTDKRQYCSIGSVKTNIGHLEAAAGIAGLSKILLQMQHRTLVPSLHSDVLNDIIEFEESPFYVQREVSPWETPGLAEQPLRAALSSFGAGGANVHVVLEAADTSLKARIQDLEVTQAEQSANQEHLFLLSANNRVAFKHRLAIVAKTSDDVCANLQVFIDGGTSTKLHVGNIGNATNYKKLFTGKDRDDLLAFVSERQSLSKMALLWVIH